jgi:tetratricopeptide (TPR) repeat protein
MLTARIVVIALNVLALATSVSSAGPVEDCNQVRDLDRQLRGCTLYIEEGSAEPHNLATAHLNRGNIYARRGKHRLALADYGAAVRLDPRNALAHYNRGNAYYDSKQLPSAIADFTRAVELEPRFALAYFNRGRAHERRGDHKAAVRDYRSVLKLEPAASVAKAALAGLKRLRSR